MKTNTEELLTQKIQFQDKGFKILVKEQLPAQTERALHEEVEIKFFHEGNSALMINSDVFIAKPGDITVVNPYEIHSTVNIDQYAGRYYLIVVSLDFLNEVNQAALDLRYHFLGKGKKIKNHIQGDSRLQAIIWRVVEEISERAENYKLIVQNLMSEFFALLFRNYTKEESEQAFESENVKYVELISPALAKMHTDYAQKFTLEELAELCSVSKYHFCRIFKRAMHVTPVQYITEYRIDLAEAMLKDTAKSVTDVAWQCGFEDESYFSRCYKKIKGISPNALRRKMETKKE